MDSTGIQLIVRAHHRLRAGGTDLSLRSASAAVRRLLAICGVQQLLPLTD